MLDIKADGSIRLTRGDTAKLTVKLKYKDSNDSYVVRPTDKFTLTIKKSVKDVDPLVQKVVVGFNSITIDPEDTRDLAFGKYKYDVQLNTADGEVYTVIEPATFEVAEGVT